VNAASCFKRSRRLKCGRGSLSSCGDDGSLSVEFFMFGLLKQHNPPPVDFYAYFSHLSNNGGDLCLCYDAFRMSKRNIFLVLLILILPVGVGGLFLFSDEEVLETEIETTVVPVEEGETRLKGETPLFFTTMTHMESNFKDDTNEKMFRNHINDLNYAMDLFEEYEALMTVETEQPFSRANHVWDTNFLQEILDRGHGVGTHCDFGVNEALMPVGEYAKYFRENKDLVDDLVGAENNKGCSGGWGPNDWALAAAAGGFDYLDGFAGFAALAMPLESRPEGWTDEYIKEVTYHDPIPVDLMDRLYLIDVANAKDFEADENGVITLSGGDIGEISSLYEGRESCGSKCELTREDVQVVFDTIDFALEQRDPSLVAKLNLHLPLTTFVPDNEEVLRYFLQGLQEYEKEGKIVWATQLEVYEFYKNWTR